MAETYRGDDRPDAIYRGDGEVVEVYRGDDLVWSSVVKITGTTGLQSRDQLRAALAARGLSHATVTTIPFRLDTSSASDLTDLFIGCRALETVPEMDTSNVTSMAGMFRGCRSITSVPVLDTSNVVDMGFMFDDATALETVPAFDMGAVREAPFMFRGCGSLREAPLRELSVSLDLSDTVLDPAAADELIAGLVEVTGGGRVLTLPSTADGANVAEAIRRGWSVAGVTLPALVPFETSSTEERQIEQSTWTTLATHTVVGFGSASLTVSWEWAPGSFQWIEHIRRVRVQVNGTAVIDESRTSTTSSWSSSATESVALSEGDVVRLDVYGDAGNSNPRRLRSWSLSIVPD